MASKWFTTLAEGRAQFGGYRVNPETPTERILTRVWHGIDKVSFPTLRATLDSDTEVTNPYVDNQEYPGIWRITDIRTQDGQGELDGSLTVFQDIRNVLNDGPGEDNEYLAGLQSDALDLSEYRWMLYTHYLKRTTKKWTNLTQTGAEDAGDFLGEIKKFSDVFPTSPYTRTVEFTGTYTGDTVTSTWGTKYWNCIYKGTAFDDTAEVYHIVDSYTIAITSKTEATKTCTFTVTFGYSAQTELTRPHIESMRMQEEGDHSFTLYRTITELTYPAIMRQIYYQYAGLIKTSTLPVEDANTLVLSGFLNQTEKIYQHARFRIGSDTYRVTADATAAAGVVTVSVTPPVTAATADAHTADPSNSGAMVFFNAIG